MPCDKVNCDLKQACFEVYGRFAYPPCASEQGESPATYSQQLKAEIASVLNDAFVNTRGGICVISYQQYVKLRQLSAV